MSRLLRHSHGGHRSSEGERVVVRLVGPGPLLADAPMGAGGGWVMGDLAAARRLFAAGEHDRLRQGPWMRGRWSCRRAQCC